MKAPSYYEVKEFLESVGFEWHNYSSYVAHFRSNITYRDNLCRKIHFCRVFVSDAKDLEVKRIVFLGSGIDFVTKSFDEVYVEIPDIIYHLDFPFVFD